MSDRPLLTIRAAAIVSVPDSDGETFTIVAFQPRAVRSLIKQLTKYCDDSYTLIDIKIHDGAGAFVLKRSPVGISYFVYDETLKVLQIDFSMED